ncbi:MAG: hypothetical protein M1825_003512 [Sarcosagium campestre]|nr:MAG: hypothetical protein M1825_003512 [Sarcosagium campestre]
MLQRARSKDNSRSIRSPSPAFMTRDQVADYLSELRSNPTPRPGGSRPQPIATSNVSRSPAPRQRPDFVPSMKVPSSAVSVKPRPSVRDLPLSQRGAQSTVDHARSDSVRGRPLVKPPQPSSAAPTEQENLPAAPTITYIERGQRWMERQEARSLSEALHDMDLRGDEKRLHEAAQMEASNLVWQHQNSGISGPEPRRDVSASYKDHLKKGSHARSHSSGPYAMDMINGSVRARGPALPVNAFSGPEPFHVVDPQPSSAGENEEEGKRDMRAPQAKVHDLWDSPQKKAYISLTFAAPPAPRPRPGNRRTISGGSRRNTSGNSLFRNPNDQIYEEPEDELPGSPLNISQTDRRMPVRPLRAENARANTLPTTTSHSISKTNIHMNPPSQSRNPDYVTNALPPTPPESLDAENSEPRTHEESAFDNQGLEVRSKDIRNATSARRSDRSTALPTPFAESNDPARPIVSFDSKWKPAAASGLPSPAETPTFQVDDLSFPSVPPGKASTSPPSIHVDSQPVPELTIDSADSKPRSTRPLPTVTTKTGRPQPQHFVSAPAAGADHFLNVNRRATAACAQCSLPIAGRIVSAANTRFHPECFACYHCAEGLECVAFYPEPEAKRKARIGRIRARCRGEHVPEEEGKGQAEDGDETLRFYCHLDFHELYSPRCRSCKTPIEGEVVVACGGEWHVGHFFCAECGDPFDSTTPFVEKDGYAWCVGCHTNRYSTKCKKCRRPVTDTVIRALGAEWHEACFCCVECSGEFVDGRYFLRGPEQDPICQACQERMLKA